MSTATEITPLPSKMVQDTIAVQRQIQSLKVTDSDTYAIAVDLGKEIKQRIKVIKEFFQPMKRKADEAKRAILDAESNAITPLEQAEQYLSQQAGNYRREQERIATQKRIEAEDTERKRIADLRALEAAKAREQGREKLATAIEAAPIDKPKVNLPPAIPQVRGTRNATNWKFEIEDEAAIPREYLTPDLKKIGEFVRGEKEQAIGKIPGVKVMSEEKLHFL